MVFLRGRVAPGSDPNAPIAVIPSGNRPYAKLMFAVACSSGVCRLDIDANGTIWLPSKSPTWVSLSGAYFYIPAPVNCVMSAWSAYTTCSVPWYGPLLSRVYR